MYWPKFRISDSKNEWKNIVTNDVVTNEYPSEVYIACFEGNIHRVRQLLEKTSFEKLNRHECNGSTPLHAAVECGHVEIVHLLLHQYCVNTHLKDNQGRTASQLAQTEEIKRLFRRPTSNGNRFCGDENIFTEIAIVKEQDEKTPSEKRIKQYKNESEMRLHLYLQTQNEMFDLIPNPISRFIFGRTPQRIKDEQVKDLLTIIDQSIGTSNQQYNKAKQLIRNFSKNGKADLLIRLFTLETPFYRFINDGKDLKMTYFKLLNDNRSTITGQRFQGFCYRGLTMTNEDLQIYHWAREKKDRYLEMKTFCSSTLEKDRALFHAEANKNEQRSEVLIIFEFSEPCSNAIQINSISEFEDEQEILILPQTLFTVKKISQIKSLTTICMAYAHFDEQIKQYQDMLFDQYCTSDGYP